MYYNIKNIDNSFQLVYSSEQMQTDNMDTEDIPYTDFSLNYDEYNDEYNAEYNDEYNDEYNAEYNDEYNEQQTNPNDTIQEIFHYEIEKAIDSGNINIIKNAISDYGHLIDNSYIVWANSVIFQMIEEKMEDITLLG